MPCGGHCFDIPQPELLAIEENLLSFSARPTEQYIYSKLQSWQTRIICLHPSQESADGGPTDSQLYADLLVATVSDTEGIVIEVTGDVVEYTALSYTWGRPELSEILICNGRARPISSNNAAALVALRDRTKPTYIWIDAVCIDQANGQEKSAQVARMLSIYKKARLVTAWLGEPDSDSQLAFACIGRLTDIEAEINRNAHASSCLAQLKAIYYAIHSLHDRPWLRRTWIRQEIYGARQLVVQCGSQQISWDGFIRAADLMRAIKPLLTGLQSASEHEEALRDRLLTEAQLNANMPFGGMKPPRNFLEVLLQSRDFEVTDPRDSFYAILGMCNVKAYAGNPETTARQIEYPETAVRVDYSKTLLEVYQDASMCVLLRKGEPANLADLWHSYKKSPLHAQGLPQWAIDWREGTFSSDYRATLSLDVQPSDQWTPLWVSPGPGNQQHTVSGESPDMSRFWRWPKPLESNRSVLLLKARVLNYVAHLTEFTCDPHYFLTVRHRDTVGLAGRAIHAKRMLRKPGDDYALVWPRGRGWEAFDPQLHEWRIAILGVGNDDQLCLVPSTTKKGDLVVAVAPTLLPMMISPKHVDGTTGGLIPRDDPYEEITKNPEAMFETKRLMEFLCGCASIVLSLIVVGFNISLWRVNNSNATTIILVCYGITLLFLLIGTLTDGYFDLCDENLGHVISAVFLFVAIVSTAFPLANMTGPRQIVVAVYSGLIMIALINDLLWHNYRKIDHNIEITLRREEVFRHLDRVTETLGQDYEFHGPLFVGTYETCYRLPRILRHRGIRWCVFMVAVMVEHCTHACPRFGFDHFDWFVSNFIESRTLLESAWDRPVQDLLLH